MPPPAGLTDYGEGSDETLVLGGLWVLGPQQPHGKVAAGHDLLALDCESDLC
jgi:hypothetical protein